jgi:hypothetical protein
LNAEAPAESAKSSNYVKSQIAYSIYDGRYKADKPRTSVAPPVQLFQPVFGRFLDAVKSNDALPDDLIRATTEYMKAASALYKSEEKRREALTPLLREILGINIQMVMNGDKTTPDGIAEMVIGVLLFLILLKEDKNEFGDGGSDPSTQAGLSLARAWAQVKVCYCFSLPFHCSSFYFIVRTISKRYKLSHLSYSFRWSMDRDPGCRHYRLCHCPTSD